MNIDHVFYEDEIRCDYIIPSMIKRSWAAQIQILEDLNEACEEAQLKCYAEWGTLLGTIRHRGFIPWDDDMDVCMKRKDYDYLVNNYSSILPDNYSIVSFRSNPDFKQMLCRVVSSDHYRFDADYMRKYSGLPVALGIDIFPFDYLSGDEEYESEREKRVRLVYEAVNELTYFDTPPEKLENRFRRIEAECSVRIDRKSDILLQLRLLLEKLFGEVEEADAKYVTLYPIWLDNHSYKFPVEYYSKSISMPFENTRINVPVCYDAVLRKKYGTRYMEQVRSGGAHDYPYIDNHLGVLRENFGFEWPTYRFNPGDFPGPDRK
ncbi:MAG: LicD family protein, partial [Lachnospiraceae bacterium]|nr:LicD family protein [Lachnospiraceae bacterium]